jgi:hypothetical protein
MARVADFNDLLKKAQVASSKDGVFSEMATALKAGASGSAGFRIQLEIPNAVISPSTLIEDAVRDAFNDKRKSRSPDALFTSSGGARVPVEVKYRAEGFKDVPTDSQGVKNSTSKWYLLVSGNIQLGQTSSCDAYLIRSDYYRDAINSFKTSSAGFDEADLPSINPSGLRALGEIEEAIEEIKKDLARAILRKSGGADDSGDRPRMSLKRRVGVSRVRFDVKFESLMRNYVKEILRS